MIDLTIPLYTLLVFECLLAVIAAIMGYFILRQAVRGLKTLIAFLQMKRISRVGEKRIRLTKMPGPA